MARRPLASQSYVRWWLVAPLVAAVLFLVPLPPWVVDEFYSRDFYPWLQRGITTVSNLLPLAVIDVFIGGAIALVLVRAVLLVLSAVRSGLKRALLQFVRRVVRAVAVVVIAFFAMWGCNYRRLPLESGTGKPTQSPTVDGLTVAVADANALAASLRPVVMAGTELSYKAVAEELRAPMNAALRQLSRPSLLQPGRPKFSIILTPFFTWAGVNGMVNPWALESIVHPDLLPFERPFVLAHEWAHLAGQADEAEASAVGWLACMNGSAPLAYSASLYLITEAAHALPPGARRRAVAAIHPDVRKDLDAIARRAQLEKPRVQRSAAVVYDRYLRANRVPDGAASYSRALTLILSPPIHDALDSYGRAKR